MPDLGSGSHYPPSMDLVRPVEAELGLPKPMVRLNADFPWDEFDSEEYYAHNYAKPRPEDQEIVEWIRDHFATASFPAGARAIDVGTGPNLYPALAMLPFVKQVTLYEYSAHNIDWLTAQRDKGWPAWDEGVGAFWALYRANQRYKAATAPDPRPLLSERVEIVQGSVFDLDVRRHGTFGAGTMFFVAESLSEDPDEFEEAVDCFLRVLCPGAPFAMAFMERSKGYDIEGIHFPATAVTEGNVKDSLARGATDVATSRIDIEGPALREGYEGMIVATGVAKGSVTEKVAHIMR